MTRLSRALPTAASERVTESGLVPYATMRASALRVSDRRDGPRYGARVCAFDPSAVLVRAGLTALFNAQCEGRPRRCTTHMVPPSDVCDALDGARDCTDARRRREEIAWTNRCYSMFAP